MTVAELLAQARRLLRPREGMLYPQREARSFLAQLLAQDEAWVLAHPEQPVSAQVVGRFLDFCRRRSQGEPFHLILGCCPFFGRSFLVAPGVLVPRPETELLMVTALELPLPPSPLVVDVGTGCGVLAITFKLERPAARLVATDISHRALSLARRNAGRLGAQVALVLAHLGQPLSGPFDLVLANLPYLPEGLATPLELAFEPAQALFAGPDGLALLRPFVWSLPQLLAPGGFAVLELGPGQGEVLAGQLPATLVPYTLRFDLRGVARVLVLRRR